MKPVNFKLNIYNKESIRNQGGERLIYCDIKMKAKVVLLKDWRKMMILHFNLPATNHYL